MANWLDKGIAALAPSWGVQRARARAALAVMRSYEAANSSSRRSTTWQTAGTSANAATLPKLAQVRNNARDLVRNNPYAARAIDILAAKSIGTGIRARWPNRQVQSAWNKWVKTCDYDGQLDFYGLEALIARGSFEAGEMLVRRVWTNDLDGVPLKLQLLEPEYLDTGKWGPYNGNLIISGIEIDRTGRRVAYWLFDSHPGEINAFISKSTQSRRHDAADILHFYEKRRAGQMRAVSRLAASVMRLRNIDEYQEAMLVKKKIEACYVMFVSGGNSAMPLGEASTNPVTGRREETVSPGMIVYGKQGETAQFGQPSANEDSSYTDSELHAIAVGCGVTYEQMTGDLRGVNLSSIRAGMQDFRDLIDAWRWISFVPMTCNTVENWFLEAAWTSGRIKSRDQESIWTAPRWPYMQPVDDIDALKEELRAGLTSTSASIRERGEDPVEVFAEIARDREELKKLGIVVDTDPTVAAKARPESKPAAGGKVDDGKPADK